MAESAYQQYERLLRIIEATTREEGFELPLLGLLDLSKEVGIIASIGDPILDGLADFAPNRLAFDDRQCWEHLEEIFWHSDPDRLLTLPAEGLVAICGCHDP